MKLNPIQLAVLRLAARDGGVGYLAAFEVGGRGPTLAFLARKGLVQDHGSKPPNRVWFATPEGRDELGDAA
jgi:hypothetical protein